MLRMTVSINPNSGQLPLGRVSTNPTDSPLTGNAPPNISTVLWNNSSPKQRADLLNTMAHTKEHVVDTVIRPVLGLPPKPQILRGQVTYNAEGNDNPKSPFYSRVLHWPGNPVSGVTIGRGYDMGSKTQAQIVADLTSAGIERTTARKYAAGAGLKGPSANVFVNRNRHLLPPISIDQQIKLFNVIYPRYEANAAKFYTDGVSKLRLSAPDWNRLDPKIREIVIDMTFQQGSLYNRQIKPIASNDINTLANYIKNDPSIKRYEEGRHRIEFLLTSRR